MGGEEAKNLVSLLPQLEPLFGAAFAINLAYLNLKHLRYREKITDAAGELLENSVGFDSKACKDTAWYKQIMSLYGQRKDNPPPLDLPMGVWSLVYRVFFHNQWNIGKLKMDFQFDRLIAVIATFFSALYLILGVGQEIGKFSKWTKYFTKDEIGNEFVYSYVFLFWPMIMVALASFCIWRAEKFVTYQLRGLKSNTVQDAKDEVETGKTKLDAPDLPPPATKTRRRARKK